MTGTGGNNGGGEGGTSGGTSGTSGTAGTAGGGTAGVAGTAGTAGTGSISDLCGEGGCACSNGADDDGDGLTDGFDNECTGAFDNDEGTFATGIPGDNRDPTWQDCFFDGNSGGGDDQCRYHTDCLTGDLPADDPDCTLRNNCIDFCAARTPSGCDCFGCCTVSTDAGDVSILLQASCSLDNIEDETACPRCMPNTVCGNTCGECELCLGKTEADLPDTCRPEAGVPEAGTPIYTCDGGEQVCSDAMPCPGSYYCQFGCCQAIIM